MSVYTAVEIGGWLLLAAFGGGVLGWLVGGARASRSAQEAEQHEPASHVAPQERPAPQASGSSGPIAPPPPRGRRTEDLAPSGAFRGSALPGPGGGPPGPRYQVKANIDSMTFHLPDTPTHARVSADLWFKDADAARAAGFRPPPTAP